jgi:diacylglycerol O-acyltransferase
MLQAGRGNSLSWGDTFFLYLEREGQPINVAATCELEGALSLRAFTKYVESKLDLIPRYKQRAVFPQFNLGLPTWEPDPNFDIRNHVRQVVLKAGTDADLKEIAGRIVSSTLDRSRPLWDLTLVRGLKGNRTGLIIRLHHCLADGISGVGIMNVLLGASPTPEKTSPSKQRAEVPQPTDSVALLLDGVLKSYQSFMQGALTAQSEVLTIARELLGGITNGRREELMHLVPELASPSDRLPFNHVVCHGPQRVAWGEIPMADIKAIRENFGGTVNDVVLTVVTSTVRRYSELHGAKMRGRNLRLMIPVNIRGNGDVSELGNKITFLPINVPLDVRDPRMLLAKISQRMVFLRSIGVQDLVGLVGTLVSKIPLPVQAILAPVLSQLPLSLCNMICTNVPGPQQPLYLLGHKMLRAYPYVPIGGEMGVNVAILSYNGTAYVGFGGDVHAVPDIERFEELLRVSFSELREAAVGMPPRTKAGVKKARAAASSQTEKPTKIQAEPVSRPTRPRVRLIPTSKPETPKRRVIAAKTAVPFPPSGKTPSSSAAVRQELLARSGD